MTKKANASEEQKGDQMEDEGRFTKAQKWTIVVTVLVVFIATGLNLLVRRWYGADLRYEENPYYMLKGQAVTSCLLKNYGRSPVNEVRLSVEILSKMLDIQISPEFAGKVVEGGVGQQNAVIEIERIVPKDQVTIFFAMEQSQKESIIKHIASREMLGRTGRPVFSDPWELFNIFYICWAIFFIFFAIRQFFLSKLHRAEAKEILEAAEQIEMEMQNSRKEAKEFVNEIEKEAKQILSKARDQAKEIIEAAEGSEKKIVTEAGESDSDPKLRKQNESAKDDKEDG